MRAAFAPFNFNVTNEKGKKMENRKGRQFSSKCGPELALISAARQSSSAHRAEVPPSQPSRNAARVEVVVAGQRRHQLPVLEILLADAARLRFASSLVFLRSKELENIRQPTTLQSRIGQRDEILKTARGQRVVEEPRVLE